MLKPIQSILFATDLSANCQQALDFAIAMGTRFQATIYLLHVIEKLPQGVEGRLKGLLGRHQWDDIVNTQQANVHKSLTGKTSINQQVRSDIQNFCKLVGIEDSGCSLQSREIIICDGDVAESIVAHAEEHHCDLIVLGAQKTVFSKTAVSGTIKTVLKETKIPVTIVPANPSQA